ncbi:GlxA family transcriptional regulator [Pseudomonas sp. CC120222-01a]|uniref:GlxA family transcriptional regulator n=1 Tax=Pseudomonas sp. CC120222-01a TaxID=1378075 RepID=UPI000D81795D|nr:GlxA family transcriptional regulator [Pseudomonas sp. CC120222-01a]PVZ42535.1 transcriptional regulator GlxA family with amidase domain [Pseudomonas sp. CC120222-01a]
MNTITREFSRTFADRNLGFITQERTERKTSRVGFLLLENFSLPCFTQALDVLVTANLISPGAVRVHTFSYNHAEVMSDLGIPIRPDTPLTDIRLSDLDLMVICGGLRAARTVPNWLSGLLKKIAKLPIALGGLWNGAWYLGAAGLLDGYRCAIHAEQRTALAERAPYANVSHDPLVFDRNRMTSATPNGAFDMMIRWLSHGASPQLADAVLDTLDSDQSKHRSFQKPQQPKVSKALREVIALMEANLEEPLCPEQLAQVVGLSIRQIQRLFKDQLNTTPQKYYFQLRITEARRLIQNSNASIFDVSIACGFVSCTHFSRSYSAFFGHPPSKEVRYEI